MAEEKSEISEDGYEKHYSVGIIIKDKGKYLLIDRAKFPPGYACPAGHVDKGETFHEAAIRELKEETGLKAKKLKLAFHEYIPWNLCNRGVTGHEWNVYECEWEGNLDINREEAKGYGWYAPEEIKNLHLEEIWSYLFRKLGVLR